MEKKYHLRENPIAAGQRIYADRVEVMGTPHRRSVVADFCGGKSQSVELKLEPENEIDPNAIAVYGTWKGMFLRHSKQIGYIPRELSARLKETGTAEIVAGRLLKTYVGGDGFVEVLIQIIGPSDKHSLFAPPAQRKTAAKDGDIDNDPRSIELQLLSDLEGEERRAAREGAGVAARYYSALISFYKKRKEIAKAEEVLRRFGQQRHAPGRKQEELLEKYLKLEAKK